MNKYAEIWRMLELKYEENHDLIAGPVCEENIQRAELDLGVKFCNDYKHFVEIYGGAIVGSKLLYGLKKHSFMGEELSDVVKITKFYRDQNWPETDKWYIVSDDFDGNPIGIDKEGRAWLSDHDCGFELVKLADSFEELLYRLHTDTLFSD